MTTSVAPPRTPWSGTASRQEIETWSEVAERFAAQLVVDAPARDRAGADPHREVELFKQSGLANLLIPAEYGGIGAHWETAYRVIRIIARADGSLGQLFGYHFVNTAFVGFFAEPSERGRFYRQSAEAGLVWGDSVNPLDPVVTLRLDGDRYLLNGRRNFSTGAAVGDVVLITALVEGGERDGQTVGLVVDRDRAGITHVGDWDNIGQRLTASGAIVLEDVEVQAEEIIGAFRDDAFLALVTPSFQLSYGNLYVGIAQGALDRAREITLARPRGWVTSPHDSYAEDPFVRRQFGDWAAQIAAIEALADRLNARFDEVVARGAEVTYQDRGELAVEIAKLKIVGTSTVLAVTSGIFEVTGASSTKAELGLDTYWRNARVHTVHDPVDYKRYEVGSHLLAGELPPFTLYS
jgi:alkylation response protein AidB-like acyl-CoA dehydrogenase